MSGSGSPLEQPSNGRAATFSVIEHHLASEDRRLHLPAQPGAMIWRHRMPMVERGRVDNGRGLGVPDDKVSIAAWCDGALCGVNARKSRRTVCQPLRDSVDRQVARGHCGPHCAKTKLERGDASPGAEKVALRQTFERR